MHVKNQLIVTTLIVGILVGFFAGGISGYLSSNYSSNIERFVQKNILGQEVAEVIEIPDDLPESIIRSIEDESATIEVVEKVTPGVVSIIISKQYGSYSNMTGPDVFPFYDFFEADPQSTESDEEYVTYVEVGGGTGFFVSSDGLIITNKHVVDDPTAIYTVVTNDEQEYRAEVVAKDQFVDLALLRIDGEGFNAVKLGDSDNIKIGQTVIAIGNSLSEYRNTVTKGVISGIDRRVVASDYYNSFDEVIEEAIQTDAAINPGNSGGPLINLLGEVIGINTAVSSQGESISFAVPVNLAKEMVDDVIEYGHIVRPWLGVRYITIDDDLARMNGLDNDYGAILVRGSELGQLAVIPDSPADKAGLEENDIILEIEGIMVTEDDPLDELINKYDPGDEIFILVIHDGEESVYSLILEEYDESLIE